MGYNPDRDPHLIKIKIPPPPHWMFLVLTILAVLMMLHQAHGRTPATPSYIGRPPHPHYPGRCWCAVHGPRGGCIRWICKDANR